MKRTLFSGATTALVILSLSSSLYAPSSSPDDSNLQLSSYHTLPPAHEGSLETPSPPSPFFLPPAFPSENALISATGG